MGNRDDAKVKGVPELDRGKRLDKEVDRLRQLLRTAVKNELSLRALEEELGITSARKVLSGSYTLTMAHLVAFLDWAGVSPEEFFKVAYPRPGDEPSGLAAKGTPRQRGESKEAQLRERYSRRRTRRQT